MFAALLVQISAPAFPSLPIQPDAEQTFMKSQITIRVEDTIGVNSSILTYVGVRSLGDV